MECDGRVDSLVRDWVKLTVDVDDFVFLISSDWCVVEVDWNTVDLGDNVDSYGYHSC